MVFTASLLGAQHKKGMVWRTCRQACFVSLGKALNGVASTFMWQTSGPPVLHRVAVVKLLTQHVVKDDSLVPTSSSLPCWWWGNQSIMTGLKWAAIFP